MDTCMEELRLRMAAAEDIPALMGILRRAVGAMEAAGIHQWDELYPDEAIIRGDVARRELYVGESGGAPAVLFVLNGASDPTYANGRWRYDAPFLVLHRLCVSPAFQHPGGVHRGIGAQAVRLAEGAARAAGAGSVRLDAFSQNPYALRLYEKLGYRRVGEALLRKGLFYLFEKKL